MIIKKKWKIPLSADILKTRNKLTILVNNIEAYIHEEKLQDTESLDAIHNLIKEINVLEPNIGNYYKALFAKHYVYEEKSDTEKESCEEQDDEGDASDLDFDQ